MINFEIDLKICKQFYKKNKLEIFSLAWLICFEICCFKIGQDFYLHPVLRTRTYRAQVAS